MNFARKLYFIRADLFFARFSRMEMMPFNRNLACLLALLAGAVAYQVWDCVSAGKPVQFPIAAANASLLASLGNKRSS